LGDSDSAHDD